MKKKHKMQAVNKFKYGTIVDGDSFTDRLEELETLKHKLQSENHVILISPRRYGKSSLVNKVLSQTDRPSITIDMQYILSIENLASSLIREIFKLFKYERIKHLFSHFRIIPTISTNAVTGALEVSFNPVAQNNVLLEDAMELLDKICARSKKRPIVVIDEFQEIMKIQKGLDKQLRSLMQRQKNLNYILLGSQESMMTEIFQQKKSPFYHFGQIMYLDKIPYDVFFEYIVERLPKGRKSLRESVAKDILSFTQCHPYYTQQLSAQVWELMEYEAITENIVDKAVDKLVILHNNDFERLWLTLNRTDKGTLRMLSQDKMSLQNGKKPSSTVFSSLQRLVQKGYVNKADTYTIEDPFFGKWVANNS